MVFPEKRLIKRSITLRELELPEEVFFTKQSMVRYLCFSLGLMNENESRNTTVKVVDAFLELWKERRMGVDISEISARTGVPEKTVRYNMDKLRNLGMVSLERGRYVLHEDFDRRILDIISGILEKNKRVLYRLLTG
jgi:DNA-binding transcriptional ArsR family regulator